MSTTESSSVRISIRAKAVLQALARREDKPMQAVLEDAIDHYEREKFLESANAAFERVRKDPAEWAEELAERKLWESTLADGLERE